uniref:Uncharacterized protein LOC104226171 n=1 Tax=Nicotiana sylvestris TaxID=4096 RepID=A0A1U7W8Q0_NICSY|nr:PREDICTED: uncharacterized protein LOC104226171 [Nicotiana sylvestris]
MRQAVEGLKELIAKGSVPVPANVTVPPESVVRASKKRKRVVGANEPNCSVCKKRHLGRCWMILEICYGCGKRGNKKNKCPRLGTPILVCPIRAIPRAAQQTNTGIGTPSLEAWRKDKEEVYKVCKSSEYQIMGRGATQPASFTATSSIVPLGHGAVGRSIQSSVGPNRLYAFSDMVTGMLTFQSRVKYALIDSGSALSYVNPYIAEGFGIESGQPYDPFCVSTL